MSRIPVLLMVRQLDQGGVERDVAKMATHLDPSRFEPHVASYQNCGMRYDELLAAGIPFLHLPVAAPISRAGLCAARLLGRYLREHSIQIFHAWDPSAILGVPVARSVGVPVVISSQLSYREILDRKTRILLRATDPLCDALLVNCAAMRKYLIESEGVPAARVELCYNGVEVARFYPSERPSLDALQGASLVVGALCALRPEKGLMVLQEAFARSGLQCRGAKLLIVGSGPERERLVCHASTLGISRASVFIPAVSDAAFWMRAIDIFVLPSYSEAFSNALLEAMACGCAVIGSRIGGTPELIGDGERGLLFTSGDAAGLAAQILKLAGDPALRCELAKRAARFAAANLSMEIAASRMAAIYETLLRRAGV